MRRTKQCQRTRANGSTSAKVATPSCVQNRAIVVCSARSGRCRALRFRPVTTTLAAVPIRSDSLTRDPAIDAAPLAASGVMLSRSTWLVPRPVDGVDPTVVSLAAISITAMPAGCHVQIVPVWTGPTDVSDGGWHTTAVTPAGGRLPDRTASINPSHVFVMSALTLRTRRHPTQPGPSPTQDSKGR